MEAKMMMPANYCVMSEEEMTYTEGGATAVQAFCAWFVPFYGWYKGYYRCPRLSSKES